jgi:hypothetical protein
MCKIAEFSNQVNTFVPTTSAVCVRELLEECAGLHYTSVGDMMMRLNDQTRSRRAVGRVNSSDFYGRRFGGRNFPVVITGQRKYASPVDLPANGDCLRGDSSIVADGCFHRHADTHVNDDSGSHGDSNFDASSYDDASTNTYPHLNPFSYRHMVCFLHDHSDVHLDRHTESDPVMRRSSRRDF